MILLNERLNEYFRDCFQKNINIKVSGKPFIDGKLLLFKVDGFRIYLTISKDNEMMNIDIPYPFDIFKHDSNIITLDYRFETLAEKNYNLLFLLQSMFKRRKAKFYNTIAELNYE